MSILNKTILKRVIMKKGTSGKQESETVSGQQVGPGKSQKGVNKADLAVNKSDLAVNTVQITRWMGVGLGRFSYIPVCAR